MKLKIALVSKVSIFLFQPKIPNFSSFHIYSECLEYEGSVKTGSSGLGVSPLLPQRSSRQITGDVPPLSETEFPVQFIVGGKDARVGQFPHMVKIILNGIEFSAR